MGLAGADPRRDDCRDRHSRLGAGVKRGIMGEAMFFVVIVVFCLTLVFTLNSFA